jgi:catechol 2,3-dioxygenase-like lactoylglutathione lyase family enzyme
MKKLIPALWLISTLATGVAWAQPYAPNDAGVTNGHWHLNSRDVAANKHILLAMGGVAAGPGERVVFPGVLVILNQGPNTPPSTGGTVGTVVNHIGFTVPNVQEAVAKWKAAGVPFEPGAPGRLNQGWVTTTDGLKIEIQEDKDQKEPIRSKHVHFFLPENAIAQSQAWYGKVFGAKASVLNNAPVADLPGVQLRYNKVSVAEGPTKGRVLDHIGFDVKDLKAFIAKMEAAGVKLDADGAYRVNDVGVGIAFITDPWGTRIELNERPKAVYLP